MVKANPVPSPSDDHEVRLMGAWSPRNDGAPTLIERRDEDFLAALLVELAGSTASELTSTSPRTVRLSRCRAGSSNPIRQECRLELGTLLASGSDDSGWRAC